MKYEINYSIPGMFTLLPLYITIVAMSEKAAIDQLKEAKPNVIIHHVEEIQ